MYGNSHAFMHHMYAPPMGIQMPTKPVGIFWDIENCPVPKGKNASSVINFIRNFFIVNRLNHREFEFMVACDVTKMKSNITDDINKAEIFICERVDPHGLRKRHENKIKSLCYNGRGVTLAHVSASCKNGADEKLREAMKKFVDGYGLQAPLLILVSGDIDFVNDLRGYQTRLGCAVIIIHGPNCSQHFKTGWTEIYPFETFLVMMGGVGTQNPSGQAQPNAAKGKYQKEEKEKMFNSKGQGGFDKRQENRTGNRSFGQSQNINAGKDHITADKLPTQIGQSSLRKRDNHQRSNKQFGPPNERKLEPGNPQLQKPGKNPTGAPGPDNTKGQNFNQRKKPANLDNLGRLGSESDVVTPVTRLNEKDAAPLKKSEYILLVLGLPGKMDYRILKENLQRNAGKVHGRVKFVKNGQAFITFHRKENAENAISMFHGLKVYGKTLNVQFAYSIPFENAKLDAKGGETAEEPNAASLGELAQAVDAIAMELQNFTNSERNQSEGKKKKDSECSIQ